MITILEIADNIEDILAGDVDYRMANLRALESGAEAEPTAKDAIGQSQEEQLANLIGYLRHVAAPAESKLRNDRSLVRSEIGRARHTMYKGLAESIDATGDEHKGYPYAYGVLHALTCSTLRVLEDLYTTTRGWEQ